MKIKILKMFLETKETDACRSKLILIPNGLSMETIRNVGTNTPPSFVEGYQNLQDKMLHEADLS